MGQAALWKSLVVVEGVVTSGSVGNKPAIFIVDASEIKNFFEKSRFWPVLL
jgi:hypothetical protein